MNRIYLDHAAASPLRRDVLEDMMPYLTEVHGNPSSVHAFGREAHRALNGAREQIAAILNCTPRELIWTSGGTESDNLALFGVTGSLVGNEPPPHIITSQIEHHAILHACSELEQHGIQVSYVPVNRYGQVDLQDIERAIRPGTVLISIMYANNEVGTIQPIFEIGELARSKGIAFHVDAVQAAGHLSLDLARLPVDLMSFSAHKLGGPKGIGLLYCSSRIRLHPRLFGGSQERKRRAGTENVAFAVGFASALQRAVRHESENNNHAFQLRQAMLEIWTNELSSSGFVINGHPQDKLLHILNVSFPGVSTETLLMNLDLEGIAAASGSACTSGALEPSHVLKAMNLPAEQLQSAVRFSFGPDTTLEEVRTAAAKTATIVQRLRTT
ncbi:cysteine desulfurase family protein [Paenibacillus senegalensis]|uniref:cysteine desulfurase family protein n=1 Tax=Paenibacillus senegalensis TaxID=1465766 RepID=UPI000288EAA7|nr:cysteine desulfurase family protein [Paenibacillus senegalensis]